MHGPQTALIVGFSPIAGGYPFFPNHCESLYYLLPREYFPFYLFFSAGLKLIICLVITRAVNVGIVACFLHTILSNDSEQPGSLKRASTIALSLARDFTTGIQQRPVVTTPED